MEEALALYQRAARTALEAEQAARTQYRAAQRVEQLGDVSRLAITIEELDRWRNTPPPLPTNAPELRCRWTET
jgi:hypothetical protein